MLDNSNLEINNPARLNSSKNTYLKLMPITKKRYYLGVCLFVAFSFKDSKIRVNCSMTIQGFILLEQLCHLNNSNLF